MPDLPKFDLPMFDIPIKENISNLPEAPTPGKLWVIDPLAAISRSIKADGVNTWTVAEKGEADQFYWFNLQLPQGDTVFLPVLEEVWRYSGSQAFSALLVVKVTGMEGRTIGYPATIESMRVLNSRHVA